MIRFNDETIALPIFDFNKTLTLYLKNDGSYFLTDGWNTSYITLYNPDNCKRDYFSHDGYFNITIKMRKVLNRLAWLKFKHNPGVSNKIKGESK